jgi:hypothetical protein
VHPFQIDPGRRYRRQRRENIVQTGTFDPRQHGLESFRPLGVTGAGEMIEVRSMGTEQHSHDADATVRVR